MSSIQEIDTFLKEKRSNISSKNINQAKIFLNLHGYEFISLIQAGKFEASILAIKSDENKKVAIKLIVASE